jgi:hypothetical protein
MTPFSVLRMRAASDPSLGYITPFIATALWSMRKRNSAYSGYCIRVQNVTAGDVAVGSAVDIGFGADGWVDAVALAAAYSSAGSSDGLRVLTWYDQSGSGLDLTGAAATAPRISSAATIDKIAGRPSIRWNTAAKVLSISAQAAFGFGTAAWSVEAWAYPTTLSAGNTNTLLDFRASTGAGYMLLEVFSDKKISFYNGSRIGAAGSAAVDATLQHFAWGYVGGSSSGFKQFIGGTAQSSTTQTFSVGATRPLRLGLSQEGSPNVWPGMIVEAAVYSSNQFAADFTPRSYT